MDIFIATLKLDRESFGQLQTWRQRHFPPTRNFLLAHLTLFHTLSIAQVLQCGPLLEGYSTAPLPLRFFAPRFLGRGTAIEVHSPELDSLRKHLITRLHGRFTAQDRAPFHAHVTIQNKIQPAEARRLFEAYEKDFVPWSGTGLAIQLWKYLGGPWDLHSEVPLAHPNDSTAKTLPDRLRICRIEDAP